MENKDSLKLYMGTVTYVIEDKDVILFVAKDKEEAREKFEKWLEEESQYYYLNWYLEEINEVDGHKIEIK